MWIDWCELNNKKWSNLIPKHPNFAMVATITHGLLNRWTSHWLFRGAKKYDWGGGAWDPNYDPGADFLDHNFLSSKNSG